MLAQRSMSQYQLVSILYVIRAYMHVYIYIKQTCIHIYTMCLS